MPLRSVTQSREVAEHEHVHSRLVNIHIELYNKFLAQPKTLPIAKGLLTWGSIAAVFKGSWTKSQDC